MWTNPKETLDLVTFTEEILNGKLHCMFRVKYSSTENVFWYNEIANFFCVFLWTKCEAGVFLWIFCH